MPTLSLPDDFFPRATQVLMPRLATPDEREAWLAQAFFLNDPRLYHDLRQMQGAPIVYTTRLITALLMAKCIPGRTVHALTLLLNAVRIGSAPNEQREIDSLVTLLDPICSPDSAPEPEDDPVPVVAPVTKPAKPLQTIDTPVDERTPTVFISYSHQDDGFAKRLIDDLQNAGHAIWIDTVSIKGGDAWVRSIADGIRNSYAFVTVLSPDANSSRWVLREYLLAENLMKPIYPVMARLADIPFQMIDRQVVSLVQSYTDGLTELLGVLPVPSIPMALVEEMSRAAAPPPFAAPPSMQPAPAPMPPPASQQSGPVLPPLAPAPKKSGGIPLPDIGGMIGDLKDLILGRDKEKAEEAEEQKKVDSARRETPGAQPQPAAPAPEPAAAYEGDYDDDEAMLEEEAEAAAPPVNRRALELQYVQRLWAENFSAQQDAPETGDDMVVRWMALPADADLDAEATEVESSHVNDVGAGLAQMRRAVVMGDSPREVSEVVWSALDALMQQAIADPSKPLPILINLARWTDADQPLDDFVHTQLGELADYWHGLLEQKRAALLFTGFELLPDEQRAAKQDAVETFLRAHPQLPALVAKQD